MGKIDFKPGNMLYPLPAVLVTVRDADGKDNMITIAWVGTVCTNPPMLRWITAGCAREEMWISLRRQVWSEERR